MVQELAGTGDHTVEVVGFDQVFAKDFAELNYEWIAESYIIEEHDREVLDHPLETVIQPGGQIFFALVDGRPVGTVALIRIDDASLELAKMAVSPNHRGLGLGDKLMSACIEHATAAGKARIVLESNTKQVAAINLYRKFGFVEIPLDPNSAFERANIRMELAISRSSM